MTYEYLTQTKRDADAVKSTKAALQAEVTRLTAGLEVASIEIQRLRALVQIAVDAYNKGDADACLVACHGIANRDAVHADEQGARSDG